MTPTDSSGLRTRARPMQSRTGSTPIVCAIDSRFVLPLCVLMESLADANAHVLDVMRVIVLHEDLSPESIERLRFHATRLGLHLELRRAEVAGQDLPVSSRITKATYLRLRIGDMFPDEQRVLYVDADMVVLSDIEPLLAQSTGGHPLAAVVDPTGPRFRYREASERWRKLGVPVDREYFNAGLILFDLQACADTDLFERADEFLVRYPELAVHHDQDALNWAADGGWERLNPRWNTFPMSTIAARPDYVHRAESVQPLRSLLQDESRASILHFSGRHKPWQDNCPDGPSLRLYRRYLHRVVAHE
ncbi:glycosyltransferase family 8 protein [Saccharothrix obliqua]|uniref:glycosyltransferase family 8 protein n=1 Tax=Saccharothrix obliqua TaxID=2861747 RepID=UPI001C605CF5|nr:glycosyltransferase family 8 protein [Saccharothrix obliqua]MBW4722338.1 glycosyltransferase family 8 protein [Saccharothrix obliqua]